MNKFFKIIKEEFEDADSFCEFIKYVYYKVLPYDYRPGQMWYKLKCFVWHRYTTVKPRQLDHTWCDKTELVPHMMFEMLSKFLEKECSPGVVDWKGSNHRIQYGGHSRNVQEVMWHLYHWWHKVYLLKRYHEHDEWHKHFKENTLNDNIFNPIWKSNEDAAYSEKLFGRLMKKEEAILRELNENLKTIVDLIPFLWT